MISASPPSVAAASTPGPPVLASLASSLRSLDSAVASSPVASPPSAVIRASSSGRCCPCVAWGRPFRFGGLPVCVGPFAAAAPPHLFFSLPAGHLPQDYRQQVLIASRIGVYRVLPRPCAFQNCFGKVGPLMPVALRSLKMSFSPLLVASSGARISFMWASLL